MWNPIKIYIKNLFAHKESSYEFKNNTCTVIFGRNDTDKGLENNGAGKTTLFEAICIALTNESLRSIKKDNFINRDEDFCRVEFELENPALRMNLKICRQFYRSSKPVKVEIWENGVLNTQVVSVNEANKRVLELIGVGREDLLKYFIISQDNHYTFFTASDTEKKEIMNRITSADMINPIIDELSNRLSEKQAILDSINSEIERLSDKRDTLEEQRQEIAEAAKSTDKERIKDLELKIKETEEKIEEKNEVITKQKKQIKDIDKKISKIEVADKSLLKKSRKEKKEEIEEIEEKISEYERIKRNLENELSDKIACPECGHEFIPNSDLNISVADAERLLKETEGELKKQNKVLKKKQEELKEIKEKIDEANQAQDELDELESEKHKINRSIVNKTEEVTDFKNKIVSLADEIKSVKKKKNNNAIIESISKKILECSKGIDDNSSKLSPIIDEIEMIRFWQFNMGKSGFKTYLANKSVKIIEGITNSYLRKFGVDISVLINGFTILRSGEVREKIDVFVSNDGITAENFMAKSGGERGRVMLAGILGIQHLINLSTNGKGLNLLCFDECFHGMDSRGQENIIKIFEKIGITILVITQNVSESFNNENTLFVVKENGVSKYI